MAKINVEEAREKAKSVLEAHHENQSELITMLQEIQEEYHYLPQASLDTLAEGLNIPSQAIYGVATFYAQFSLNPKGKYLVKVCNGTACHVKNGALIRDAVEKQLGLSLEKNSTEDGLFTLETVNCVGACGIAPVMVVNDQVYPQMTPDAAVTVISHIMNDEKGKQATK